MKKIIYIFLFNLIFFKAWTQDVPLYIHTFNNFYLQNPSMAGYDGHGIIFLTAHKQIIADREDAPQFGTITFHSPIRNSRSAIGLAASYFKRSFLNTGGVSGTFAHRIDLDENQHVRFGLSVGYNSNSVDISLLDNPKDLYYYNTIVKKSTMNGQFGISYQLKKFNLGLSFPRLFNNYSADSTSSKGFYAVKNYILMTSFKFNLSHELSFQPLIYYRSYQYATTQFEVNGIFNYKDKIWTGATFRQDYGMSIMLGVKANNLSISYAYKIPNASQYNYANPAHEIQLALHLKKPKKHDKNITDNEQQKIDSLTVKNLPEQDITATDTTQPDVREVTKEGGHPLELQVNHYVVVGSFKFEGNAQKLIKQLKASKIGSKVGYNTTNQRFYVYTYNSNDLKRTLENYNLMRAKPGFEDTWILKIVNRK